MQHRAADPAFCARAERYLGIYVHMCAKGGSGKKCGIHLGLEKTKYFLRICEFGLSRERGA